MAAVGRYTLASVKVHAYDASVPVLDPDRGSTKIGLLPELNDGPRKKQCFRPIYVARLK